MSFAESVARSQEAVFRALGEDATWEGVPGTVRIRRRDADEELRLDEGAVVASGHILRVRESEVGSPALGQAVQVLDSNGNAVAGARYKVSGEPMLDRAGVWECQAVLA